MDDSGLRRRATRGFRWRLVVTLMRKCRADRTLLVACCRIVPIKAFGIIFHIPCWPEPPVLLLVAEVGERAPGNIIIISVGHVVPNRQRRATPAATRDTRVGHARNDDPR